MKKKTKQFILILVCAGIVLGALCLLCFRKATPTNDPNSTGTTSESTTSETEKSLSISELIDAVKSIKSILGSSLSDIKGNRLDSAREKLQSVPQHTQAIRTSIDQTVQKFHGSVPFLQKKIDTVLELLDAADTVIENIALPAIDLLQAHPVSELHVDDGINTRQLCAYLDFIDTIMPDVESLIALANSIDFSWIDTEGEISGYLDTANSLLELYHADEAIISKMRSMLGEESDRTYLLAAQNSSEIRASGGFPGSVGVVRIQDGILTLDDFEPVNDILSAYTSSAVRITPEEYKLFGYMSGMHTPRDADLCPDFERVAFIWADGYKVMNRETLDGVIAMTPHIVQRLLKAADQEITLSDGSVLNGENATKALQYDLYFKYFSKNYPYSGREITNELFSESAKKTMDMFMNNMRISSMLSYLTIVKESFADRTLMVWMVNEAEQALIENLGWNGGLNTDPEKPQAGIYYNCTVASKLGWFFLMDTQMGERYRNEDGSYSYPVTVTFTNDITQEEIAIARPYISGIYRGTLQGSAYFFAPAGGSVSNFESDQKISIKTETYHDLELGFVRLFQIKPGESVTVTYTVTTAPGVETPLSFSKTPTAQQA